MPHEPVCGLAEQTRSDQRTSARHSPGRADTYDQARRHTTLQDGIGRAPASGFGTKRSAFAYRWGSAHLDVRDLDGVVAVADPVPRRDVGLDVAGRISGAGPQAVPSGRGLPRVAPVLPLVGGLRRLDHRGAPFAFTDEAHPDVGDGAGTGPGLAADRVRAGGGGGFPRRGRDPGPPPHVRGRVERPVRPLVDVMAGLELA